MTRGKETNIPKGKPTVIVRCIGPCERPKAWPEDFASDGKGGHRKICKKCWGFQYDQRNKLRAFNNKQNALIADQLERFMEQQNENLEKLIKQLRNIKQLD